MVFQKAVEDRDSHVETKRFTIQNLYLSRRISAQTGLFIHRNDVKCQADGPRILVSKNAFFLLLLFDWVSILLQSRSPSLRIVDQSINQLRLLCNMQLSLSCLRYPCVRTHFPRESPPLSQRRAFLAKVGSTKLAL